MKGMAEGSGTHSSLLWEVRRLLDETPNLPQVLVMENVPQIHSKLNIEHFKKWLNYLESKGYSSFYQDMNAADYGIPQSRRRTICVSVLGYYNFKFPNQYKIIKRNMDYYLEDNVDEKYYLTNPKAKKLIEQLVNSGKLKKNNNFIIMRNMATINEDYIPEGKVNDVAATILARDYKGLCNFGCNGVCEVKVIGQMDNSEDHTFESANRVYDPQGLCPTIPNGSGGGHQPKIITICALRGRNPDNPKDRKTTGIHMEQMLEPNQQGICNSLTTVQKDNLVLEITMQDEKLKDWIWEIDGLYYLIRIRRLTPRECWRLMDFTDEDYEKAAAVNSSTQLYKQAGNSIVKNVLCEVFKALINKPS